MIRRLTCSVTSQIAAAAFATMTCGIAAAHGPSAYGFTVDFNTLGPSTMYPGATAVWVQYDPGTSFECSPPRGCYAKMQRINFTFSCAPMYAVMTERVSYDLNGNVVKHEIQDIQSTNPTYDTGARLVLATYCPQLYRRHP